MNGNYNCNRICKNYRRGPNPPSGRFSSRRDRVFTDYRHQFDRYRSRCRDIQAGSHRPLNRSIWGERNFLLLCPSSRGSVNVAGVNNQELNLCAPVSLRPGDTIRVLTLAAASRNAALCVYTNQGIARIFTGTPSGSGTTQLTDLQDSSNNIGDTLQGQTVVKAMLTSVDGSKLVSSGGAWIRNASGQLAGVIPASNPIKVEPMITNCNIPIALNWTASLVTNA